VEPLTEETARSIGRLLADAGTSDVIDTMVALGVSARDDAIVTSDPDDLARMVTALHPGRGVAIIRV
jgi:hypothetical protein